MSPRPLRRAELTQPSANGSSQRAAAAGRTDEISALDAIRRIVRALRVSSRASELQIGLSGAQLFVLEQLAQKPAESLNELAERTMTHQSSVSVVVSRLVERGLVSRDASIDDSRRVTLSITPAGRQVLRRAPDQAAQARLVTGLREIPPRELKGLARTLRRLAQSMEDEGSLTERRASSSRR